MKNRLKIITEPTCTDGLRTAISEEGARLVLLNPPPDRVTWVDGTLCLDGQPLSRTEVAAWAVDRHVNRNLSDRILLYALFAYLYDQHDLRHSAVCECSVNEFSYYTGLSVGRKGYPLLARLQSFEKVYGWLPAENQIVPLLQVQSFPDGRMILRSEYLHRALNLILTVNRERYLLNKNRASRFYCNAVSVGLVRARNKVAAAIVVELAILVVRAGKAQSPHISLRTLAKRVPELHTILYGQASASYRSKQLRRALSGVRDLIMDMTSLPEDYVDLEVIVPQTKLSEKSVIVIQHCGKRLRKAQVKPALQTGH